MVLRLSNGISAHLLSTYRHVLTCLVRIKHGSTHEFIYLRGKQAPEGTMRTQWGSTGIVRSKSRSPSPDFGGYGQSAFPGNK